MISSERKFKNKSFPYTSGATCWSSDACKCVIIFDKDGKWLDTENNCKIHNQTGTAHLNAVKSHNASFNIFDKYPKPTQQQKDENSELKANEKKKS